MKSQLSYEAQRLSTASFAALGIHPCFCCSDGLLLPLQILGAPPLFSPHFPLLVSPPFVRDFSGVWVSSCLQIMRNGKIDSFSLQKHFQSHLPPCPHTTVIVTIKSDHCPSAQVQDPIPGFRRMKNPGSWSIMGKAGPVSALMTLQ